MTYGRELSEAWNQHLRPRDDDAPTVVSLFAGAGGSSLGYSMAGFRELLAVEWDRHAAGCLGLNFLGLPIHFGDVVGVRPDMVDVPIDVLDGSPPCQGFSSAGLRQLDDPRNQLFREFIRLLRAWMPRALVVENVSGMGVGKMRPIFREVMGLLRESGYRVVARELVASYYRVPQRRHRLIIIGVRDDLGIDPSHPDPISAELTVREAFDGMTSIGKTVEPYPDHTKLIPHIKCGQDGKSILEEHRLKGHNFGLFRADYDTPSKTILKNSGNRIIHPRYNRLLGTLELSRLQSFPDEYQWGRSSYNQIQERLGNSVPPLLMRAIAQHIRGLLNQ